MTAALAAMVAAPQEFGPSPSLSSNIDNMKVMNDTSGHGTGDMLIYHFADRLAQAARPNRAYRIGSDQFAVYETQRET